jgi:geranylgeranyl diphosphate synthase type I
VSVPLSAEGGFVSVSAAAPVVDARLSPVDVEDVRVRVQIAIDDFLAGRTAVLTEISTDLEPLTDALADLMTSGKRLRAAFCYWGWRGTGREDAPGLVSAATALELFHAAALVHDDVMDDSDTRRGRETVHRRFERLHDQQHLRGLATRHGVAAAILAGNLCQSWADEMLAGCGLPPEAVLRGRHVFDLMRTQVVGGQFLDVLQQAHGSADSNRMRTITRYKSAKYTVEHPLLLGGALADASPALLAAYSRFGLPLGEAFQLRDDVLGVFGDPVRTGKPDTDDLRDGKRTQLVAIAEQRATRSQQRVLERHLGNPLLDDTGAADVRLVLLDTGAVTEVERAIARLTRQACSALDAAPLDPKARGVLSGLTAAATTRVA